MKKVSFTEEEIELLKDLIHLRIELNKTAKIQDTHKYNIALHSAYEKILNKVTGGYSSIQKILFCSVVNEHLPSFEKELTLNTAISWLNVSVEQLQVITKLDTCYSILDKSGFYTRNNHTFNPNYKGFRYSIRLLFINKLRNSNGVLLSRAGSNDYYKIALIYEDKEYIQFELKHSMTINSIRFIPYEKSISSRFTFPVMTKKEALVHLSTCNKERYQDDVLPFFETILN